MAENPAISSSESTVATITALLQQQRRDRVLAWQKIMQHQTLPLPSLQLSGNSDDSPRCGLGDEAYRGVLISGEGFTVDAGSISEPRELLSCQVDERLPRPAGDTNSEAADHHIAPFNSNPDPHHDSYLNAKSNPNIESIVFNLPTRHFQKTSATIFVGYYFLHVFYLVSTLSSTSPWNSCFNSNLDARVTELLLGELFSQVICTPSRNYWCRWVGRRGVWCRFSHILCLDLLSLPHPHLALSFEYLAFCICRNVSFHVALFMYLRWDQWMMFCFRWIIMAFQKVHTFSLPHKFSNHTTTQDALIPHHRGTQTHIRICVCGYVQ